MQFAGKRGFFGTSRRSRKVPRLRFGLVCGGLATLWGVFNNESGADDILRRAFHSTHPHTVEVESFAFMPESAQVILSAFADESANRKTAVEQMCALAAIGLKYYSPRFIDVEGKGEVKHVV